MDEKQKLNAIVNRLVGATDPDEVKHLYKEWADSYDSDLSAFGYVAPCIGVKLLSQRLNVKSANILDAGCGTGLVGSLLSQLGYNHLHGSDFSANMLEKAALTGCYTDLQTLDFNGPLEIASDNYDAAISIGVYNKSLKQHFITEMIRIIRPSGHFVFSCREVYFEDAMDSVSALLKSKDVVSVEIEHDEYMTGQDASAYYISIVK